MSNSSKYFKKFSLYFSKKKKNKFTLKDQIQKLEEEIQKLKNELNIAKIQDQDLINQCNWYKWYCFEYAASLRMLQYDKPTSDINYNYVKYRHEFISIDSVIQKIIVPPKSNGIFTKEYIFFAARNIFLPDEKTGELCLYSMSYLGNVEYAHSRQYYDSFIEFSHLRSTAPLIQLEKKADILSNFVKENNIKKLQRNKSNYFTPFSYNTGDVDKDGKHDFILGGKLLLSSNNYAPLMDIDLPQESIFLKVGQETFIISLDNNFLRVFRYQLSQLVELSNIYLKSRVYSDISHVLFPLPLNKNCLPMFAVRSQCGLDIYVVNEKMELELKCGLQG
ncbi:TPA: hypothetical protein I8005_000131 [Legionella pneumophila]|nr:hypothetical protein [Legionella pneumophila]